MKKLLISAALAATSLSLAGCETTVIDKANTAGIVMAKGIKLYCKAPELSRTVIRDVTNKHANGHTVKVHCAGDL